MSEVPSRARPLTEMPNRTYKRVPKKRPGRPRKGVERDAFLIQMTKAERSAVERKAATAGQAAEEWLLQLIKEHL